VSTGGAQTAALMGTLVTIEVVGPGPEGESGRAAALGRAMDWFRRVEEACNRFDPASELRRLSSRVGEPVSASPLLFEAVRFALALAEETAGAFDPTVGAAMESRGFNLDYRTRLPIGPGPGPSPARDATFRDVRVDEQRKTLTLLRPLVLDLGAVAKGLAIDLAARELEPWRNFLIDAGGDLFLSGSNARAQPWTVGIHHPRQPGEVLETIEASDAAVCTSGDYERIAPQPGGGHHILDLRTGRAAEGIASVTVLAPSAMVADGLATAAFVLGPRAGIGLLEQHGADGIILTPDLERFTTRGFPSHE
jgi:thiamine biosynthesis lipoprotein